MSTFTFANAIAAAKALRYQTFPQAQAGRFEVRDTIDRFSVKSDLSMADALELAKDLNNPAPRVADFSYEEEPGFVEFPRGEFNPAFIA